MSLDPGQYPEWDEHHPIHFVGHSAGAQVVRVLQQMLADKVVPSTVQKSEKLARLEIQLSWVGSKFSLH